MKNKKKYLTGIAAALFWIGIWQAAAILVHNKILVAGPLETFQTLLTQASSLSFWKTIGGSLFRIFGGFLAAFISGGLLAAISCKNHPVRVLLSPLMIFAKAVPVASFTVILLIWWGADGLSAAISFLVALPIIYVNVLEGLEQMDPGLTEMAKMYKLTFPMRLLYIVRPALAPFLTGAVKTSLSMGLKAGVAAEVIGNPKWAIGTALYEAKIYLDTAGVFSWTIVVVFLAYLLEHAVLCLVNILLTRNPLLCQKSRKENKMPDPGDLKVQDLTQRYGEKTVISHLTKTFHAGKIYCLMGASGSGKTTLLHTIAGLLPPKEGTILQDGKEGYAVMFQEDRLLAGISVLQNVTVASTKREALQVLTMLGLSDVLYMPVEALSGGMARRVSLARALVSDGGVLLLDEPFTGLDKESRLNALETIQRYQNGRIVMIATHDPEDAEFLGAEILKINRQA